MAACMVACCGGILVDLHEAVGVSLAVVFLVMTVVSSSHVVSTLVVSSA